jgi:EAL domain-containing protein (putative c-di-GMP-specific phosphodiesterase class I)
MRDATVAMRRAKRDGGGAGRLYDLILDSQFAERLALESELHRALENDELRVHFQPQISGPRGAVVGVEALVRWQHPVRGLLAPAAFIPLAEDSGLIVPMGEWVLEAACRQVKAWHDAGLAKPRLAVNLSARQLADDKLLSKITRALEVSGLEARYLDVEITETAVMADAEQARATVGQITRLGVGVALDDFGTGYSSLSLLSSLPVGTVKIDRSFVAGMLEHDRDMMIVTSVIALGRRLGLNVVAEGVETREQFDALRRNGCDEMQGYLFGRPAAAAECEALLRCHSLLDEPAASGRTAGRRHSMSRRSRNEDGARDAGLRAAQALAGRKRGDLAS